MNLKQLFAIASLTVGSALALGTAPAQAAGITFSSFNFGTNFTGSDPKGNIMLNSVTTGDRTITNFHTVNSVNIIQNDLWTGGNTGAASADRGDNATIGVKAENPTNNNLAAALGNLNLTSIIDTEDDGSFTMDLFFDTAIDQFLFWERGMNSRLKVQAIGSGGSILAEYLLDSRSSAKQATNAGFNMNTTEVGEQSVGALGLWLNGAKTNQLRLISQSNYNGADFKVVGAQAVPEPATMAGTALALGALATARRKKRQADAAKG
ncbi:exosortase-dependent surface protein XDP2 [Leptolyngbya sp. AN02str]|uniref:exosortase-dependent surface protein XDP2 n=1 Tax=Leptolyngbya sp. AN02str TaxID=3423363 RepID=UPI003D31843E